MTLGATGSTRMQAMVSRTLLMGLLWLVIAGTAPGSWIIGLPSVLLAAWVSLLLVPSPPFKLSALGTLRFLGYFLRESLLGGLDVAKRTLSPKLRINPGELSYTTALPDGLPVVLFASVVSLLPGTLSQRFEGRQLSVHLLDTCQDPEAAFRELELRIANMLCIHPELTHA